MRIIFICGSLEPGRDGVGDYVRRLVAELVNGGHQVAAIALNDKHIAEIYNGEQELYFTKFRVLRMPTLRSAKNEILFIKKWIDSFHPDLLSLQFVPFAFDKRGISFGLSTYLKMMAGKIRWHIMFHELWIGYSKRTEFKKVMLSYLQRWQISNLVKVLRPRKVHTHLPLYQIKLKILGVAAKALPLFSKFFHSGFVTMEFVSLAIKKPTTSVESCS